MTTTARVLVLLLSAIAAQANERLAGDWLGVLTEVNGSFLMRSPLRLNINADASGNLNILDLSDPAAPPRPLRDVQVNAETFTASMPLSPGTTINVTGRLSANADALHIEFALDAKTDTTTLHRQSPDYDAFFAPRLDARGEAVAEYTYSTPDDRGDGWRVRSLADESIEVESLEEMVRAILREDFEFADGVLIVRNGSIVFEEYFRGSAVDSAHHISSATKSLTSILIGIAIDKGLIASIDEPVTAMLPIDDRFAWMREQYPITLRHVLSMTAGLEWNENVPYSDPRNSTRRLQEANHPLVFILDVPLADEPGSRYVYNSGLSTMLGYLLEASVGESIQSFAAQHLFEPLGIENYKWAIQPDGTALAAGGFRMTMRDMAKLGQLMLNEGSWNGRQIVSADWVAESTRQQTPSDQYPYGYQWHRFTEDTGIDGFLAAGFGEQHIAVIPALQLVVVLTGSNFGYSGPPSIEKITRYIMPAVNP